MSTKYDNVIIAGTGIPWSYDWERGNLSYEPPGGFMNSTTGQSEPVKRIDLNAPQQITAGTGMLVNEEVIIQSFLEGLSEEDIQLLQGDGAEAEPSPQVDSSPPPGSVPADESMFPRKPTNPLAARLAPPAPALVPAPAPVQQPQASVPLSLIAIQRAAVKTLFHLLKLQGPEEGILELANSFMEECEKEHAAWKETS